jgi:hypothetical protein
MKNTLEVRREDFVAAVRTFHVRKLPSSAMLAFEDGFLSIEAGDRLSTMHAQGEWHGRAWFSTNLLKALAVAPPTQNPIAVVYADGKLRIGTIVVDCEWQVVSEAFIKDVMKPSPLDLLAMDRTLPRAEIHGTGLAKRVEAARSRLAAHIRDAAKLLKDAEISEDDLWNLAESHIQHRLQTRAD